MAPKRVWGASDLARYFNISVVAVHKRIKKGTLPENNMVVGKGVKLWSNDLVLEIKRMHEEGI